MKNNSNKTIRSGKEEIICRDQAAEGQMKF